LQQKHIGVVAYCSYYREDRGIHTYRGIHSSSHDSRRRDLSNAKINTWKNNPILGERAHRHGSRGSDGHMRSMRNISLALHQSDIHCSKWEILFRGISRHPSRGRNPKESSGRGSIPKERTTLFH
jgi:hypothetical protein